MGEEETLEPGGVRRFYQAHGAGGGADLRAGGRAVVVLRKDPGGLLLRAPGSPT